MTQVRKNSLPDGAASKISQFLGYLGLDRTEISVYLYLLKNGRSSVLEISNGLKTGRTKLYPILDGLADKQLVLVHEKHYGSSYEAAPTSALEFLVDEVETKAATLKNALPALLTKIDQYKHDNAMTTKVVEYRGLEGLKQINFNLTKAQGEFMVFEVENLEQHPGIPKYFAERIRTIQTQKKIMSYDLTNNRNWHVDTKVKELKKYSRARYIDPKVFKIEFETMIYNDCVAMLNYHSEDIFGVEIYNSSLMHQQKQLFQLLWGMGTEV